MTRYTLTIYQPAGPQYCQQQQGPLAAIPAVAYVALAATAVSTGVGVMSAIQSSNAQKANANYQSQVAANNAQIASNNAKYAQEAGNTQAQATALQTRAEVGGALAAQASSGLDVNSGSAVDVRSSDAAMGTLSELNVSNNASRQAYGYQTQSSNFTADAGMDAATAANAGTAGAIGAASSVIGGVASGATSYAKFNTQGINLGGGASNPVASN